MKSVVVVFVKEVSHLHQIQLKNLVAEDAEMAVNHRLQGTMFLVAEVSETEGIQNQH